MLGIACPSHYAPIPFIPHLLMIHVFVYLCVFRHVFAVFLNFFPWMGVRFGNVQWLGSFLDIFFVDSSLPGWGKAFLVAQQMVEETHEFWVFIEVVLAPVRKLGSSPMFLCGFPFFPMAEKSFLVLLSDQEDRSTFWSLEGIVLPM